MNKMNETNKWSCDVMKLPVILSGPIIRRVEASQIYIWIATSQKFDILPELYQVSQTEGEDEFHYDRLRVHAETKTIKMGDQLYIHLIKVMPHSRSFPIETLLGYNLQLTNESEEVDLQSLGFLTPHHPRSIVYGNLQYPTFFIHGDTKTNILYGSCRKPHGEGPDALVSGDHAIEKSYLHLSDRPSSLFLLGGQIYADDVADPIAPFLFNLGEKLMGNKQEDLAKLNKKFKKDPLQPSSPPLSDRQSIMENDGQFTSRNAKNHLITLGEYAAMYLLAWNPDLWDLAMNSIQTNPFEEELQGEKNFYFMYPDGGAYINQNELELLQKKSEYDTQSEALTQFYETLPKIRRLLANIPTYMIFDDHDVTDDWNSSFEWKEKVSYAPLGRHVVANGLGAYWAFQGWGNDPDSFDRLFIEKMENYFESFDVKSKAYRNWIKLLWNFDSWSFVAPTQPKTVFLDTRTQRNDPRLQEKERVQGPELIRAEAWARVSKQLTASGWKSGTPLVIVSAVPFYGIELIEHVLFRYISPLRHLKIPVETLLDLEAWQYNGKGVSAFLNQMSKWNPSHCFILSGDAHIASSAISDICFQDGEEMTLHQFTSSPLKNGSFSGVPKFFLKTAVKFYKWTKSTPIKRSCSPTHKISHGKQRSSDIWYEAIRFHALEKEGALFKTNNNLGLLTIDLETTKNTLLMGPKNKLD
ncbi:hypothetical protein JMM81_22065 [Bacillus sp. V3B]|uniref:hypothetical protein n=1 Tax=Bacillus sp. V3B TaxID=2804915 RepID=UPI00210873E8|nr:hypothetical protein [Bacillus sp. V3B]MCQ6277546.1 hypothetical protein [Bacillus sp. V3B]